MLNSQNRQLTKIIVTQGSPHGIGLEIFIKALRSGLYDSTLFLLITHKASLEKTLKSMNHSYSFHDDKNLILEDLHIECEFIEGSLDHSAYKSFMRGIHICRENPHFHLVTMPATKRDLSFDKQQNMGHTDILRKEFHNQNITMNFVTKDSTFLVLSDHISLYEASRLLETEDKIDSHIEKISTSFQQLCKTSYKIDKILLSGLNPHCGEGGMISKDDEKIAKYLIPNLKNRLNNVEISGPHAADSMVHFKKSKHELLVYFYHDQGLGVFKALNGLIGINLTLGLPFIRCSVDHGTAEDIAFQNKANHQGFQYLLDWLLELT